MIAKLMPLVLLLVGSAAGVGAGIFLRPPPAEVAEAMGEDAAAEPAKKDEKKDKPAGDEKADKPAKEAKAAKGDKAGGKADDSAGMEYVKLNNQFVVPVVKDQNVAALVVLALSLEVPTGNKDAVYLREPKVRDSILQVLFDHANIGGFDGAFTEAKRLDTLRSALREVAQRDLGKDVVNDVLILEIARQDY